MECRGLAGTGWSHYKDQAVRPPYGLFENGHVSWADAEVLVGNRVAGVENTDNHVFQLSDRRHGRDPQFHINGTEFLEINLSVLRLSPFGDIQLGHYLDAGRNGIFILVGYFLIELALTVNPDPDDDIVFPGVGLDMDVRSPALVGIVDDLVDQFHDDTVTFGNFLDLILHVRFIGEFSPGEYVGDTVRDIEGHFLVVCLGRGRQGTIETLLGRYNLRLHRDNGDDLQSGCGFKLFQLVKLDWVCHRQGEGVSYLGDGHNPLFLRITGIGEPGKVRINVHVLKGNERQVVLGGD